jgi:hypothetical protein
MSTVQAKAATTSLKATMNPSPWALTTNPFVLAYLPRTTALCSRMPCAGASPMRCLKRVDSTMSVNKMVTMPQARCAHECAARLIAEASLPSACAVERI